MVKNKTLTKSLNKNHMNINIKHDKIKDLAKALVKIWA